MSIRPVDVRSTITTSNGVVYSGPYYLATGYAPIAQAFNELLMLSELFQYVVDTPKTFTEQVILQELPITKIMTKPFEESLLVNEIFSTELELTRNYAESIIISEIFTKSVS